MKEYLTIVLSFLIGITAHHEVHLVPAHKICPDVTGDHDILLPDPKDCSVYYRCENGTAIPQSCPPGLAWCQILQNCTLPILANCTLSHTVVTYSPEELVTYNPNSTTTENPVTGPTASSETCPKDGTSVPNPEDCRKYYKCKKGKPHPERCPGKKHYSTWLGICISPEIANCINVGTQENKTCPVNGARNAYPSDCSKYYECVGNTVEIKQCPSGKEYNTWFKNCYSPELAYCHPYTTVRPTTSPTTMQTPGPDNTCPEYGYKLPNPLNCTTYYVCENNSPTLQNCPAGFEYSCWVQECLPPSDGQCVPTQGQSCKNSEEKLPNSQDCHSYFECKNGTTVKKYCKNGLQYNSWFRKCVRPNVAHCKIEEPTTPTTSPNPPHTPSPSETSDICPIAGAKLPDQLDCHSYYICKNETPVKETCPQDMEYSCWDQECLPAEAADCIDNINQTDHSCKTDNTTMPNIYDCSSYYKCENGKVVLVNCDNGLEFNAWYGKCVNSSLSHCKRSTTENPHTTPTTTPPNVLCSQPGLQYPSTKYCNAYMICDSKRQLKTVECNPSTFHYNCETRKCENMTHCCSPSTKTMPPPTEGSITTTPTGGSTETTVSPGGSTETTVSPGGSTETTASPGGSTETTVSPGGSTETTVSPGGSTETTVSPGGSIETTAFPGGSTETTVSPGGSTETTVSPGGSTETTVSPGGSTETTVSPGGSTETTVSPGGSTETTASPGGSTETTVSPGGSTETTVSPGGSTETTASPGGSTETTVSPGGSTETTVSPGGSTETTVSPSESTETTASPGGSTETTVSPGGSTETTVSPGGSTETTVSPGVSTETTVSPGGSTETTASPGGSNETTSSLSGSTETTASPGGSTETTASPGGSTETTVSPGGSTETTVSPGGSTETTVSPGGSNETTVSPGGSTETTVSPGGSTETTASPGGSTETTVSPGGSTETTVSPGGSTETTVSPGGSTETTVSPGGSTETTVSPGGSTETTASPGVSTETTASPGGSTETTVSPGGSTETTVSPGGSTETTVSPGGSTETTVSPGGSTETTASPGGSTETTASPGGSNETTASPGGSTETTVSPGGSTETTVSPGGSTETTVSPGGSTETTVSPGGSTETTVSPGGSTETTVSPGGSTETTVSPGGSTETTASPGGSTETTVSPGGSTETTVSPGGSTETTVSPGGSTETTVSPGGSTETTVSPGGSTETTVSPGGSTETTVSPGGSTETTVSPGGSTETTASPGGSTETTVSPGGSTETTVSPGGSTETTVSPGGSTETTVSPGGSTETTASPGGSTETTASPGGSNETTSSLSGSTETTASPGGSTETTVSPGGSTETTVSPGGSTETTVSPGGSTETTASPGGSTETTVSPGGSTETTASPGGSTETTASPGESTETTASPGGSSGNPSETSVPTRGTTPSILCPKSGLQYPSSKYCNAYMRCDINRQLETVECNPSTFHYNCETKTCENITHCCSPSTQTMPPPTGTTLITTPTSTPSPSTTDDVCPSDGAKLPNPLDCTSYFICRNNTPITQHCPSGQEYSCWNQQCEDPKDAVCIDSSHPGQSCSHNDEKLPNIGDCGSYYQCVKGKTELKQCSSGKLYNKWFKKCVNASLSHCETYPTSPGSGTPTTISPSPTQNVCPFEGARLPNPMNCSTYFVCLNNEPSLESCPPGQGYSCWDQECESSAIAECITNSQPGDCCSINNLLLPNIEDCRSYYKCQNGSTVTMKCPPNTQFNSWFQKCVKTKYAHCQPTTSPSTPTTITTPHTTSSPSATEDVCPIEGAKLPNPLDCSSYFICINETAQKQQCPSGQEYSCWDQKCEKPENSTCIKEGSQEGQQCSTDGEKQQNVADCSSYYECDHGKIMLKYCSKGKFYSKWYKKCLSPQFAHCKTSPTIKPPYSTLPPPTTVSPSTTDDICPFEGALLPNPLNCSTYFTCINNEPTLESCPSGQGYSCWNQQCESGAIDACNPNSGVGQSCSVDGLILPISGDCGGYLECINGTVGNKTCPPKKKYNSWFGKCVESKYSHCLPSTTVSLPTTPTKSPNTCPLDGAILPNPLDCNSYFICEKEKIVKKRCPAGQIYSCWDQKCKIPQDGTCINQGHQQGQHCSTDGILLPNIDSCSSYYQCFKGKIEVKFCGSGKVYNKWLKICVSSTIEICITYPTVPAITTPPGPTDPTSPSEGNDVCPTEGALIPNPLDCATYYKCIKGTPVLKKCPDGYKYSCWDQQCEPDNEATCVSEGGQNGKNCSVEGLRITDVTNCNNYYECFNGTTILKHCPHGEEFNANFQKCYKPKLAHCHKHTTITPKPVTKTTPTDPTAPSEGNDVCPTEGALIPNPLDCATYYKCIKGTPVLKKCPDGNKYSCWDQQCEPDNEATCVSEGGQNGKNCSVEGIRITDVTNCNNYYECFNGTTILKHCPHGEEFNANFQKCYKPKLAHCHKHTTITPKPVTKTTTPTISPITDLCPFEGALLPNPLNCSTYYKCVSGTPVEQLCADGYEYSCWIQECKPHGEAQCITDGIQTNTSCKRNGQQIQNPRDCHSYYKCENGKVQEKRCPLNWYYNKWFHICVPFANLAHCKPTTVTVSPTTMPTTTPGPSIINDICPTDGILLPDPLDCSGYYICINSKPTPRKCPSGQKYSCWDQKCKAASDAQCINAGIQVGQNCSRDGVRLQNLESCLSHYECVHGKVQKIYCFIGFQYNRWYQKCVPFPYAHCKTYSIQTTITTTPTTVSTSTKKYILCPINGLKYPSTTPGDCGGYMVCENYQPVKYECPIYAPTYNCETKKCEFQWGRPHCCAPPINT